VIDVEPLIVAGLDRLVPLPSGQRADWQDVLQRAGETRRRRRWLGVSHPGTWSRLQIALAVIVVGLMLAAAATATYVAIQSSAPSKRLVTGQVVKLQTRGFPPRRFIYAQLRGTEVSFADPYRYGYQADETGFVVGDSQHGLHQPSRADFAIGVNRIELPLEQAVIQLERTPGVRVLSVDKGDLFGWDSVPYPSLGGHPSHLYRLLLSRPKLHEIFGIPAQSFSRVNAPQRGALERRVDVVLIGDGGKTFLVRFGNGAENLDSPHFALMTLKFRQWSDEIVPPFGVSKADVYRTSRQFCSHSHPWAAHDQTTAISVSAAHAYARRTYPSALRQPAFEGCLDGFP
jgi:hypothetical protein